MKKCAGYVLCLVIVCILTACGYKEGRKSDAFTVKIVNATSEDIYGIEYAYYENEKLVSSGGVCNADNSAIKIGEAFTLEEFPESEEFEMDFSVVDKNGNVSPCFSRIHIKNKESYVIQITGNIENGFESKIQPNIDKGYFGFEKKDYIVLEEEDSHGGFHGDGSYYLILDCSENKEKALENLKGWNELPLSKNLNLIIYGNESYTYHLAEMAKIPEIEHGYFCFWDRNADVNHMDDTELFNRYSFNFSFAIYDSDTDIMYYLEFDT